MQIFIETLSPDTKLPTKNKVGFDLYAFDDAIILPGQRSVIGTGFKITSLPSGTYGKLLSVTGMSIKHGIEVSGGIIEPGYTDEVKVVLYNHDPKKAFVVKQGYKIAHLVLKEYKDCELHTVIDLTLNDTNNE
jgi:dUTP pyrophosphatase